MRLIVKTEWLFAALGLLGAGALAVWPDEKWIGYLLIGTGTLVLLFGVRFDEGRVRISPNRGNRLHTIGPWILILGGPILGLVWLYVAPATALPVHAPFKSAFANFKERLGQPVAVARDSLPSHVKDHKSGAHQEFFEHALAVYLRDPGVTYILPLELDRKYQKIENPTYAAERVNDFAPLVVTSLLSNSAVVGA